MQARARKTLPVVFGTICFGVAIFASWPFTSGDSTLWPSSALFFLGGCLFIWLAFRKTPELDISEEWIAVQGMKFPWENIAMARVFDALDSEGKIHCIEIQFKSEPKWSLWSKLVKLSDLDLPKACLNGVPLASEPRVVIGINHTDKSDEEINTVLKNRGTEPATKDS